MEHSITLLLGMVEGLATSRLPGELARRQNLRPIPKPLSKNLHGNKQVICMHIKGGKISFYYSLIKVVSERESKL